MLSNSKKVAVVTGAAQGIGLKIAERLFEDGYSIALVDFNEEVAKESAEKLSKEGQEAVAFKADVSNRDQVFSVLNQVVEHFGDLNVLVNNAGLAVGLEKFYEYNMEDVDRMVDTNIKGFTYIANTIIPLMIATDKVCTVVNIGSVAGEIAYPNGSIYCATKFAVRAISDAMRSELIDKKIKVTNIKPGLVDTEFSLIRFKGDKTKADNVYKGIEPLYAEDIADTIAYVVNLPEKIQITDLTITPLHQANGIHIFKEK